MPLESYFTCPLPNGIHARPASALEEFVRNFRSDVTLFNERTQRAANGKSVLSVVGADFRLDDRCRVRVSGPDEREAHAQITAFLRDTFPHCDQPLKAETGPDGMHANGALTNATQANDAHANATHGTNGQSQSQSQSRPPPCLEQSGATIRRGIPVVPGIAFGRAVFASKGWDIDALPPHLRAAPDAPGREWLRIEDALEKLVADCDRELAPAGRGIEAELLKVHRSIARDSEFRQRLQLEVMRHGRSAADALALAEKHFSDMLTATGNALLRERALDIQDVCAKLARRLYGDAAGKPGIKLAAAALVFAESLTPGQFLAIDRCFLKGLVLAHAGVTSHTVILARSFGIPTLAGLSDFSRAKIDGQDAVLDADAGVLVTDLTDAARRYYDIEQKRIAGRRARLQRAALLPGATRDGRRVEIAANIATADEAAAAFENGAGGIGLFRTEMLFLDRKEPPCEEEQFNVCRAVLDAAGARPVVIRTLDAGGDKQLGYLEMPAEENPFLGCRAVRLYPKFEMLFRTQIRALIRASAHGNLRVMIPMISTAAEARWVKKIIAAEQQKCAAEKIPFDAAMRIGAMIEVPAAAFAIGALAREFDFFSIGSNDLLQYFMAADRMNAQLGALYDPLQPAFLRLLGQIADAAHARRKEVGLCGEIDAQARMLPLLVGLGLDKISASAPIIARLKTDLAALDFSECRELAAQALDATDPADVVSLLGRFAAKHAPPLLDAELIITGSDAATKEEVIKQAADRMYVLGRTENACAVGEAVWLRESKYTTGFGYGFAIPHCKTDAVRADSLVLLKTRAPVAWNSLDGRPVRVIILLAIRESHGAGAHMKVLARLARKVMDDEFRAALEREDDPARLHALLQKALST
jgi:fructose-specific PTS system IIA-like component